MCVIAWGRGEAVDLALKLAYGATGRGVVVVADGAYHGNTGLSVRKPQAPLSHVPHVSCLLA